MTLHLITRDNISEYVEIPLFIEEKVNKGNITLTHFSDIIRILLLERYGGIWVDSTLFFQKSLMPEYLNLPFYSIKLDPTKHQPVGFGQRLTECKWAGFILSSSCKHSPLFVYLKQSILDYWKNHNTLVDYFIMNRLIKIAYNQSKVVKKEIDLVPYSNNKMYDLKDYLNSIYTEYLYNNIIGDSFCFKLSYKMQLHKLIDGQKTIYGHILENN